MDYGDLGIRKGVNTYTGGAGGTCEDTNPTLKKANEAKAKSQIPNIRADIFKAKIDGLADVLECVLDLYITEGVVDKQTREQVYTAIVEVLGENLKKPSLTLAEMTALVKLAVLLRSRIEQEKEDNGIKVRIQNLLNTVTPGLSNESIISFLKTKVEANLTPANSYLDLFYILTPITMIARTGLKARYWGEKLDDTEDIFDKTVGALKWRATLVKDKKAEVYDRLDGIVFDAATPEDVRIGTIELLGELWKEERNRSLAGPGADFVWRLNQRIVQATGADEQPKAVVVAALLAMDEMGLERVGSYDNENRGNTGRPVQILAAAKALLPKLEDKIGELAATPAPVPAPGPAPNPSAARGLGPAPRPSLPPDPSLAMTEEQLIAELRKPADLNTDADTFRLRSAALALVIKGRLDDILDLLSDSDVAVRKNATYALGFLMAYPLVSAEAKLQMLGPMVQALRLEADPDNLEVDQLLVSALEAALSSEDLDSDQKANIAAVLVGVFAKSEAIKFAAAASDSHNAVTAGLISHLCTQGLKTAALDLTIPQSAKDSWVPGIKAAFDGGKVTLAGYFDMAEVLRDIGTQPAKDLLETLGRQGDEFIALKGKCLERIDQFIQTYDLLDRLPGMRAALAEAGFAGDDGVYTAARQIMYELGDIFLAGDKDEYLVLNRDRNQAQAVYDYMEAMGLAAVIKREADLDEDDLVKKIGGADGDAAALIRHLEIIHYFAAQGASITGLLDKLYQSLHLTKESEVDENKWVSGWVETGQSKIEEKRLAARQRIRQAGSPVVFFLRKLVEIGHNLPPHKSEEALDNLYLDHSWWSNLLGRPDGTITRDQFFNLIRAVDEKEGDGRDYPFPAWMKVGGAPRLQAARGEWKRYTLERLQATRAELSYYYQWASAPAGNNWEGRVMGVMLEHSISWDRGKRFNLRLIPRFGFISYPRGGARWMTEVEIQASQIHNNLPSRDRLGSVYYIKLGVSGSDVSRPSTYEPDILHQEHFEGGAAYLIPFGNIRLDAFIWGQRREENFEERDEFFGPGGALGIGGRASSNFPLGPFRGSVKVEGRTGPEWRRVYMARGPFLEPGWEYNPDTYGYRRIEGSASAEIGLPIDSWILREIGISASGRVVRGASVIDAWDAGGGPYLSLLGGNLRAYADLRRIDNPFGTSTNATLGLAIPLGGGSGPKTLPGRYAGGVIEGVPARRSGGAPVSPSSDVTREALRSLSVLVPDQELILYGNSGEWDVKARTIYMRYQTAYAMAEIGKVMGDDAHSGAKASWLIGIRPNGELDFEKLRQNLIRFLILRRMLPEAEASKFSIDHLITSAAPHLNQLFLEVQAWRGLIYLGDILQGETFDRTVLRDKLEKRFGHTTWTVPSDRIPPGLGVGAVQRTVSKAEILAKCFEKVKGLFVDPAQDDLVFNPDIVVDNINQLDAPEAVKVILRKALEQQLVSRHFDQVKHLFIESESDDKKYLVFNPSITKTQISRLAVPEPVKAILRTAPNSYPSIPRTIRKSHILSEFFGKVIPLFVAGDKEGRFKFLPTITDVQIQQCDVPNDVKAILREARSGQTPSALLAQFFVDPAAAQLTPKANIAKLREIAKREIKDPKLRQQFMGVLEKFGYTFDLTDSMDRQELWHAVREESGRKRFFSSSFPEAFPALEVGFRGQYILDPMLEMDEFIDRGALTPAGLAVLGAMLNLRRASESRAELERKQGLARLHAAPPDGHPAPRALNYENDYYVQKKTDEFMAMVRRFSEQAPRSLTAEGIKYVYAKAIEWLERVFVDGPEHWGEEASRQYAARGQTQHSLNVRILLDKIQQNFREICQVQTTGYTGEEDVLKVLEQEVAANEVGWASIALAQTFAQNRPKDVLGVGIETAYKMKHGQSYGRGYEQLVALVSALKPDGSIDETGIEIDSTTHARPVQDRFLRLINADADSQVMALRGKEFEGKDFEYIWVSDGVLIDEFKRAWQAEDAANRTDIVFNELFSDDQPFHPRSAHVLHYINTKASEHLRGALITALQTRAEAEPTKIRFLRFEAAAAPAAGGTGRPGLMDLAVTTRAASSAAVMAMGEILYKADQEEKTRLDRGRSGAAPESPPSPPASKESILRLTLDQLLGRTGRPGPSGKAGEYMPVFQGAPRLEVDGVVVNISPDWARSNQVTIVDKDGNPVGQPVRQGPTGTAEVKLALPAPPSAGPTTPGIYKVRVQVLNAEGKPVGAVVDSSLFAVLAPVVTSLTTGGGFRVTVPEATDVYNKADAFVKVTYTYQGTDGQTLTQTHRQALAGASEVTVSSVPVGTVTKVVLEVFNGDPATGVEAAQGIVSGTWQITEKKPTANIEAPTGLQVEITGTTATVSWNRVPWKKPGFDNAGDHQLTLYDADTGAVINQIRVPRNPQRIDQDLQKQLLKGLEPGRKYRVTVAGIKRETPPSRTMIVSEHAASSKFEMPLAKIYALSLSDLQRGQTSDRTDYYHFSWDKIPGAKGYKIVIFKGSEIVYRGETASSANSIPYEVIQAGVVPPENMFKPGQNIKVQIITVVTEGGADVEKSYHGDVTFESAWDGKDPRWEEQGAIAPLAVSHRSVAFTMPKTNGPVIKFDYTIEYKKPEDTEWKVMSVRGKPRTGTIPHSDLLELRADATDYHSDLRGKKRVAFIDLGTTDQYKGWSFRITIRPTSDRKVKGDPKILECTLAAEPGSDLRPAPAPAPTAAAKGARGEQAFPDVPGVFVRGSTPGQDLVVRSAAASPVKVQIWAEPTDEATAAGAGSKTEPIKGVQTIPSGQSTPAIRLWPYRKYTIIVGEGPTAKTHEVTTPAPAIKATAGKDKLQLTWTDCGANMTYEVTVTSSSGTETKTVTVPQINLTALTPGTRYTVKIKAIYKKDQEGQDIVFEETREFTTKKAAAPKKVEAGEDDL